MLLYVCEPHIDSVWEAVHQIWLEPRNFDVPTHRMGFLSCSTLGSCLSSNADPEKLQFRAAWTQATQQWVYAQSCGL